MNTRVLSRLHAIGGKPLLSQLIDLHLDRCEKSLSHIEDACENGDWESAMLHTRNVRIFSEEIGTEEDVPYITDLEETLSEKDGSRVINELKRIREVLKCDEKQLKLYLDSV